MKHRIRENNGQQINQSMKIMKNPDDGVLHVD